VGQRRGAARKEIHRRGRGERRAHTGVSYSPPRHQEQQSKSALTTSGEFPALFWSRHGQITTKKKVPSVAAENTQKSPAQACSLHEGDLHTMVARLVTSCNSSKFVPRRADILENPKVKMFLVTYDLFRPGQDYTDLIEAIKQMGITWAHPQLSVWIVRSNTTAAAIRDSLLRYLDSNDKLLVCELGPEAAWSNQGQAISKWLLDNLAA
jgi:hypothetical protein